VDDLEEWMGDDAIADAAAVPALEKFDNGGSEKDTLQG